MEIEVPGVSTDVALIGRCQVLRRHRISWSGVLWFYIANERRKRQLEVNRSTCRKPVSSPTKVPQHIQSDHFFVPSGRSKCISHKQDREVNAGVTPKHTSAILGTSHVIKLSISYKMANDIACSSSQAIFPTPGKLDRECWSVASPYDAVLRAHIEVSGKSRRRKEKKGKEKKKSKSYGYCCLSYQLACH